ncbi:hypothetical protein POM88_005256 [Heracleum sosnowskyi]|uniref:Uncharacterized protein n=1 Tax=Heracleum sosnowskyi TaxID=360622 RepID=A0AAD8JL77_9APIA|nr:hypothetical protein POM88_005256 [Heracleum sosnowskyi]
MYPETMHLDGLVAEDGDKVLELSSQKNPQVPQEEEALNFLHCNGSSTLLLPREDSHTGKGKGIMNSSNLQAQASTSNGQVDVNISPWENQLLYQTGTFKISVCVPINWLAKKFPKNFEVQT